MEVELIFKNSGRRYSGRCSEHIVVAIGKGRAGTYDDDRGVGSRTHCSGSKDQ